MTKRDKIESVAQSIYASNDYMARLECPECGKRNLLAEIEHGIVTVVCKTPLALNQEDYESWHYCTFYMVVSGVDISAGPFKLNFAEDRQIKPPVRTKRTRRPRTTTGRKTKTSR